MHVCYIGTVSRFVFDYDRYVRNRLFRPLIAPLVAWDKRAAQRPTHYVANARNVANRIERYYGRTAEVLHPPVDVDRFEPGGGKGAYFLVTSRLLPYKRVDLAIRAAAIAGVQLLVAGTGPAEASLRNLAENGTTTMLGYVGDAELKELMRNARATILPGEEDFGLVPLESAASGRPTIAYRAGGALETIVEYQTGEFFDEQTPESLADILATFDDTRYDPRVLRAHAERFAPERFIENLRAIVARVQNAAPPYLI